MVAIFLVPISMIASNYFKKKIYDICLLSLFYFGAQKKNDCTLVRKKKNNDE